MGETSKQVRVDNWGIFFLQRLQMFFNKTDYCDLTLQFEGNVQLKVHRLVINACTEYFQILEQTCEMIEDILIMPADLQADVVLPIVNFMYTGMLEFHSTIFEKLYKTADLMNMTVLTKLLDAQRLSIQAFHKPKKTPVLPSIEKRTISKIEHQLHEPLPPRKVPALKRKSISISNKGSNYFTEQKRQAIPIDPLASVDNTPKPTRFEWPEEDLPAFNMFDTGFNDISYSSKPLFTQNEEPRPSTSFNSIRVKNNLLEDDEDLDFDPKHNKRKGDFETSSAKRVCINEKENNSKQAVSPSGKITSPDVDHAKIISEVLKKYPSLVKKNKNIRLKILAKTNGAPVTIKKICQTKSPDDITTNVESGPWQCAQCSTETESIEFALYYLYRKHMTEVHHEKFDSRLCKYCGYKSAEHSLLVYHQYTSHGIKPPLAYNFPKCKQCSYIALNETFLKKHNAIHSKTDLQCGECNMTFNNRQALTIHMHIADHTGKSATHECQHCRNKFQSSSVLLEHVKQCQKEDQHIDNEEEAMDQDEYVLPEQLGEQKKDKIKILSDVKVPSIEVPQQTVSLEPSSEAEALNNVATGIATSLGLVDVVVLDDNQQYLLHADHQHGISGEGSEYILPDLQHSETFSDTHNQVVSTGDDITMLHNTDISSTDELVMVLTDQDYNSDNPDIGDHSNIVVLYSHPVEDNQFIPSGNIVINTQSGLIDLRNTSTITTSSTSNYITTQSHVSVPSQIESIELIQQEINGNLDENKSELKDIDQRVIQSTDVTETVEVQTISNEETRENEECIVAIEENKPTLSETCAIAISNDSSTPVDNIEPVSIENTENDNIVTNTEINNTSSIEENEGKPPTEVSDDVLTEIVADSTELITELPSEDTIQIQENVADECEVNEIPSEKESILTEESMTVLNPPLEVNEKTLLVHNENIENQCEAVDTTLGSDKSQNITPLEDTAILESKEQQDTLQTEEEPKHIPGPIEDSIQQLETDLESQILQPSETNEPDDMLQPVIHDAKEPQDTSESQDVTPEDPTVELELQNNCEGSPTQEQHLKEVEVTSAIEESQEKILPPQDTQRNCKKTRSSVNHKTAKIILDDWDDTDSQQSDSKTLNVNKLIDDWDDEEDEGKKGY